MSRALGAALLLALAGGAAHGAEPARCPALVIVDVSGEERALGRWPLRVGERVIWAYTHSAEGLPAEEGLELREDGRLHLVFSRSPQHGAGHVPDAPLRESAERPGWQEATLDVPLTPFRVYTAEPGTGDARLIWRGRSVWLSRLYPRRHLEWRVELVSRVRSEANIESVETPGSQGATRANTGSIQPRSDPKAEPREACGARPWARPARNAASRDGSALECRMTSETGH